MSVIPVSFVRLRPSTKPWITPVLISLINKRWCAYRQGNFILYNHYKAKVKQEIMRSKRIWSERMCSSVKGTWSVVREIRNKNNCNSASQILSLYPDIVEAAESLNSMFSSYFVRSPPPLPIKCEKGPVICNRLSVLAMLKRLRTYKAPGSDNIPPILLKMTAEDICLPLSIIFNLSFASACFPSVWKVANICPVPKTMPVNKTQLRPISLLPIVSKLCERAVLQFYRDSFLKCYDDAQFSYRPKSSTVCALLTIQDIALRMLDDSGVVGVRIIADRKSVV